MWISVILQADATRAEALSEALMEHGALSVSIDDADAGTEAEKPQFGEPGMSPASLWDHSRVVALFDTDADLADGELEGGRQGGDDPGEGLFAFGPAVQAGQQDHELVAAQAGHPPCLRRGRRPSAVPPPLPATGRRPCGPTGH